MRVRNPKQYRVKTRTLKTGEKVVRVTAEVFLPTYHKLNDRYPYNLSAGVRAELKKAVG